MSPRRPGPSSVRPVRSAGLVVLLALASVAAAACGSGGEGSTDPAVPTPSPPSTTGDADGGPAVEQVVFAGDSVMRELASGLVTAVEGGGVEASYVLQPALANQPDLPGWEQRLADQEVDVVVLLVGNWEALFTDTSTPGWEERYVEGVLDPFVDVITAGGAELVILGYPPNEIPAEAARFDELNALWEAEAAADPDDGLVYVDAGAAVSDPIGDPAGTYATALDLPGEGEVQVRQTEGLHLCPPGVVLMAEPVLGLLAERYGVEAGDGWEDGDWRREPEHFELPELCPDFQ